MWGWLKLLLFAAAVVGLGADSSARRLLPQDAYVWQRQWTPALSDSIHRGAPLVGAWRVLAAQAVSDTRIVRTSPDWQALAASDRPVILVVRIDGQLTGWDSAALTREIVGVWDQWRAAPFPIAGIEIDHDCATARLPAYAAFLQELRTQLPAALALSITALPTWLVSKDMDRVVAQADEVVLQVHAIQNPRSGLFNASQSRQWIKDFARRTDRPFRVALPAYGARVAWNEDDDLIAVEGEAPLLISGARAQELMAPVRDIAEFLHDLQLNAPQSLRGVVWFRLPIAGDRRAWSFETWRAVVRGENMKAEVAVALESTATPGLANLVLVNDGDVDAALPARLTLPGQCALADGINGYVLKRNNQKPSLDREIEGLLRSRHRQTIGWVRCALAMGDIHVEP